MSACVTAGDEQATQPKVEKPATISREAWGSDPLPIPDERRHEPKFITIHHAGVDWKEGSDPYEKVRNLQTWGKKTVADGGKDWPDLPYHYLIAPDGTIFEGRPVEYEPENTTWTTRTSAATAMSRKIRAARAPTCTATSKTGNCSAGSIRSAPANRRRSISARRWKMGRRR
jgi:hypothetical protein